MKLRRGNTNDVARVARAMEHLRLARDLLLTADCPKALERVRSAIKSTDGALRHAHHRAANDDQQPLF